MGGFAYELLGGKVYYIVLGSTILVSVALLWFTAYVGKKKNIPDPTAVLG